MVLLIFNSKMIFWHKFFHIEYGFFSVCVFEMCKFAENTKSKRNDRDKNIVTMSHTFSQVLHMNIYMPWIWHAHNLCNI